jgi:hypothetical protein
MLFCFGWKKIVVMAMQEILRRLDIIVTSRHVARPEIRHSQQTDEWDKTSHFDVR